ncbi:MAG TPA: chemotaxis protein CheW [Spirochaetota bacterium]|nr:chemotaxis protein CheW [Spirochaetota bacterium]HOR44750.1 chemotaxis protein CheW [Spirochaetota bacterium]HPK56270.1 chemotaxis protein CheW [Spirochaetota bacterium]
MAFSLGEYQDIFLEEADDQIQELNKNLLQMEQNPEDEAIINNIFRAAHSLKSSAAFVGLNDLSDLAHKMENLLQGVRDKTIKINQQIIDVLFRSFDFINAVIESVSQGEAPQEDLSGIIREIQEIHDKVKSGAAPAKEVSKPETKSDEMKKTPKTSFTPQEKKLLKKGLDDKLDCYEVTVFIEKDAQMKWVKAQLVINNVRNIGQVIKTIPDEGDITDETVKDAFKIILLTNEPLDSVFKACDVDLIVRIDVVKISLTQKDDKYVLTYKNQGSTSEAESKSQEEETAPEDEALPSGVVSVSEKAQEILAPVISDDVHDDRKDSDRKRKGTVLRTVKVSVDKLDELLNNVGELVIANSGFYRLYDDLKKQNADKTVINEFKNRMEQMSRIAKDLQGGIMKTRMVPIGQVFERFNRLVRDLARECGKSVQLVTNGEDTELDKKVVDVIGEPLIHMIRNSIDHGIESIEERLALRKPESATVTLNAYQGGNQIYVEVIDDGKGLNIEGIKRKALERNLVTPEILSGMDNEDIYEFIFHPGFSTAEKITDVSGRGVGMNVVKEVVNEMNGSISIETEPGMGTRFIMAFPLTLAIIPAIMVSVLKEVYAIPLSDVIETIKIAQEDITTIEGHEVINLRGEILSLLRLNQFVGLEYEIADLENIPVVVVGYNNRKIGLIVGDLVGKMEIVIKSLEQNYVNVDGLAGASILGDGSICLILDISSMINKVISEQDKIGREERSQILKKKEASVALVEQKELSAGAATDDLRMTLNKELISSAGVDAVQAERAASIQADLKELKKAEAPSPKVSSPVQQAKVVAPAEKTVSKNETPSISANTSRSLFSEQTTPVRESSAVAADENVKEALNEFRDELHKNVSSVLSTGDVDEHIKKVIGIDSEDMKKVQLLANVGIMQGADSLSRMIGKRVDIAIPEVRMLPIEKIPASLGKVDDVYAGIYMSLSGDVHGTILLSMPNDSVCSLIDDLYGFDTGKTKEINDDAVSALKEITNIVGSSVVNAFSEKTGLVIMPSVPAMVNDYIQSILDSILVLHNMKNDYALIMDTVFYYEDDRIMANLLILPDSESLKTLVSNLRNE